MNAMIDVSCPRCRRRFGWCGSMANRPACPKCSHRPPQEELDAADAKMRADYERSRTDPACAAGEMLRQQRVDAGLTLRRAAAELGLKPFELSQIERGDVWPTPEVAERMADCYGVGQ